MPWSSPPERRGAGQQLGELKTLVVAYAKQETVDPLRTLGRSLGYGLAGSVLLGTGCSLLLLALLRGLQRLEVFNDPASPEGGTWSWAPYLVTAAAGAVLVGVFLWRLMAFLRRSEERRTTTTGGPR
jgi:hypothetical protein